MAIAVRDSFNRPDGFVGKADTGQSWKILRGDAWIHSNTVRFTNTSPGDMMVVNTGVGGGDATVTAYFSGIDGGGQAIYFRVYDTNRWWRLAKRQFTYEYQYQSGTSEPTYGWVGNGTYYYLPAGDWEYLGSYEVPVGNPNRGRTDTEYGSFDSRVGVYLYRRDYFTYPDATRQNGYYTGYNEYTVRQVYENQSYQQIGGGGATYSTTTATATELVLDKCINGKVSRVKSTALPQSEGSLQVVLEGTSISAGVAGDLLFTVEDSDLRFGHMHGVGFAETSSIKNGNGIDSFSAVPKVVSGYVSPMML